MRTLKYFAPLSATLLLVTGFGFNPEHTSKTVTANDVVGVWSFTEDFGKTMVCMTFTPSEVFTQQVVTATQTNIQIGKWSLDGPTVSLDNFLAELGGKWEPRSMTWDIIDGQDGQLKIYGGVFPSPNAWQEFKYLRPVNKPPSDAEIRQKLPGDWSFNGSTDVITGKLIISSNGDYTYQIAPTTLGASFLPLMSQTNKSRGTFQIRDGVLIEGAVLDN